MRSIDEADRLTEQLVAALCVNEMDIYDIDPTPVMQLARIEDAAVGYAHEPLEILERVQARHHPKNDGGQNG